MTTKTVYRPRSHNADMNMCGPCCEATHVFEFLAISIWGVEVSGSIEDMIDKIEEVWRANPDYNGETMFVKELGECPDCPFDKQQEEAS